MYIAEFFTVAAVHLLAVASPGPDFVLISRNALAYSRRTGVYTALGMALGILVHVTYSLVGIGFIISQSVVLFSVIKLLGAGYLVYVGYQCLRARPQPKPEEGVAVAPSKADLTAPAALRMGFVTNVLNPKATLFFLALFTQVIDPHTPKPVQALYGLEMAVMTFVWFAAVATVLSHGLVRNRFAAAQHRLEHVFGFALVALGIKVALSSRN